MYCNFFSAIFTCKRTISHGYTLFENNRLEHDRDVYLIYAQKYYYVTIVYIFQ